MLKRLMMVVGGAAVARGLVITSAQARGGGNQMHAPFAWEWRPYCYY